MKYPCEDCLVDVICIKSCDKLIFFLDSLIGTTGKYIHPEWIENKNKMERLLHCKHLFESTTLFGKLALAYSDLHGKSLWQTFGDRIWEDWI
jgi:hypothetical protein